MRHLSIFLVTILLFSCGTDKKKNNDGPNGRSNDGGDTLGDPQISEALGTWRYVDSGTTEKLNSVVMPFIVGDKGTLLKSDDHGETWQKRDLGTNHDLNVIKQVNNVIYIAGDNVFLLSTDGGGTFEQVPGIDFVVRDVSFTGGGGVGSTFVAVGDGGQVARANSDIDINLIKAGDLEWKKIVVAGSTDLTGISLQFSQGKIVGKGGFVAISQDAGQSFNPDEGARTDLDFFTIDGDFMAGNGMFARRYTPSGWPVGSISWEIAKSSDLPLIRQLWCLAECMAVGERNTGAMIVRISAVGVLLETEVSKLRTRLNSIRNRNGGLIAVGAAGKILIREHQNK